MNELTVAPNTLPTSTQLQAESARSLAREQRLYANAVMAVRQSDEMRGELELYCGTTEMAEAAFYSYKRGDSVIEGPSIKLMRAVACAFGYIRSGWRVLEMHDTHCEAQAFAEDMKKGTLSEIEFTVAFWRETKSGGYALTSDRDKYEIIANQASRRVRRCLEDVIPAAFVNYAERVCRKVLQAQGSLEERVKAMIEKYAEMGVDKGRLARYLQHPPESATESEVVRLGKVYRAIADGITTVEDQFPSEAEQKLKGNGQSKPDPQAGVIEEESFKGAARQDSENSDPPAEEKVPKTETPKVQKATRADINDLIKIALNHEWKDETAVKAELRDLGIAKPSDLERPRMQEIRQHLSHGPRGSWTHMYWMGTRCQMNPVDVLTMIRDVTGADVPEGGALENVEIDAIYVEFDKRALEQQQASLTLGVPQNGDTKGD